MREQNRKIPVIDDRPINYDDFVKLLDELGQNDDEPEEQDEFGKKYTA